MPAEAMIRLAIRLRAFVEFVGRWGAIFILPLVFITAWDIIFRKLGGVQYWMVQNLGEGFGSTIIQELEWHFHTALFTLVLGYTYVNNRHVRVDLVREKISFRKQAWIEFMGVSTFMIPFCSIILYFSIVYTLESYNTGEISASMVGLPHRWIIKSVLVFGILVALLSGIAVWLQTVLVLFGPKDLRFQLFTLQWPEDRAAQEQRIKLDKEAREAAESTSS
jgi:TRAP-type mannitol/chloroaromatic compound transport system permease small subunit